MHLSKCSDWRTLLAFAALLLLPAPAFSNGILAEVRAVLAQPDRLPLIVEKRRRDIAAHYSTEAAGLLWLDQPRSMEMIERMEQAIYDGLRPEDYPVDVLKDALNSAGQDRTATENAWIELLLTGHFLDYASDIRVGRVSPRVLYPDAYMPFNRIDTVSALTQLAGSKTFPEFVESWQPQDDTYRRLKDHLRHLYEVQSGGGFTFLETRDLIPAGSADPQIPDVRQRLFEDRLLANSNGSDQFDRRLAFAVAQANQRYGQPLTGDITPKLIKALNIPVNRRIEQVTNAMERIRWIPAQFSRLQLFINKGENDFLLLEDGRVVLDGEAYPNCPDRNYTTTATNIEAITLHPTWQVSWEFLGTELLPRLQSDPNAVENLGYYMRRGGADVPLSAIPWKQVTKKSLGKYKGNFTIFLPSSIENPLGRYSYRIRRDERLSLFDLKVAPDAGTYCNPFLPKTAFGIVDGVEVLNRIIEPRVIPSGGVETRISRNETITFPARGGLMAVVSHQSVWIQRQGIIRFGNDPYLEDARLTAALAGRPKP